MQSLSKQVAETEAAGLTSWLSHHLALSGTMVGLPREMENLEKWDGKKWTPGKQAWRPPTLTPTSREPQLESFQAFPL